MYLILSIDDGLVAAKSVEMLRYQTVWKMNSIQKDRENKSLIIHQSAYIIKILEKFRMYDAIAVSTLADPNLTLSSRGK